MTEATILPKCQECGHEQHWLGDHISEAHNLSLDDYLDQHPGSAVVSESVVERLESKRLKREHPPALDDLSVDICGISVPVNAMVPESACLKMPFMYAFPEHGELRVDVTETTLALTMKRHSYLWGLSGTGKDGYVHAYCARTRTPSLMFQIVPGADIEPWLYAQGFNKDGTEWIEGDLLKAARDGFLCEDGTRIPYLILITDFDRATKSQAEILRLILDSIEGRIPGPTGEVFKMLPGTTIVATANTAGGGDETRRYVSANIMDTSILGRFKRKLQFHTMEWEDEGPILRNKFPLFAEKCEHLMDGIGAATGALREKIHAGELFTEWSHRDICNFVEHAEDILRLVIARDPKAAIPEDLMIRAWRIVRDGMPDSETRLEATRLASPHIPGGLIEAGDRTGDTKSDSLFG